MVTPGKVLKALGNGIRRVSGPPVVVLIYHRVTDLNQDPQGLAVSPRNFREQVASLKESFEVFRFEETWRPRHRPGVVLTFDDGYADNFEQALPILEEFQVPATIFVSTGWVDTTDEAWWDELERIFLLGLGHSSGRPRRELEGAYWASHREIKGLPVSERRRRLDDLRRIWDVPPGGRASHRALSWEQVRRLARSPLITLGAHTVHHPQLSTQDRATQEQEIGESRRALESLTNQSIRVFSYPYGTRTDYDRNSLELVRAAGFEKVAANFNGPWFPGDSQWEIPRQLVRNWDRRTFLSKMKNFQFV